MTCEDCRERLSTYIDEEAATAERAEVERHLAECPGCRIEFERLKELTTQLREAPRLEMPVDAAARLDDAVSEALSERRAASVPSPSRAAATKPWWKKLLHPAFGGLAASMAVLVFAVIVWSGSQEDGGLGLRRQILRDSASSESELAAPKMEETKPKRSLDAGTDSMGGAGADESDAKARTAPQTLESDDTGSLLTYTSQDIDVLSQSDFIGNRRVRIDASESGSEMGEYLFDSKDNLPPVAAAALVADGKEADLLFWEPGMFRDNTGTVEVWIVVIELSDVSDKPIAAAVSLDDQILYRTE